MHNRFAVAGLVLVLALGSASPAAGRTYGDTLLASIAHRHPSVVAIAVSATDAKGQPVVATYGSPGSGSQTVALADGLRKPVGTLTASFRGRGGNAAVIAAEVSRRMYTAGVLAEPVPYAEGAVLSRHGQALIERLVDSQPGLVTLALHVAMPGRANRIVASNFGRIGKMADKDDARVVADGATLKEVTNDGRRLAVELPLLDARGRAIGALSASFLIEAGHDEDEAHARALAIRETLARSIPSLSWLGSDK